MSDPSTYDKIWQAVLGEMELIVGRASFTTWLSNTKIISIENERAVIKVPSGFSREWLEKKYNKQILESLRNFCTNVKEIQYIIGGSDKKAVDSI